MFQKKLGPEGEGTHEVNMTPLIDVSLVLVVILLLATPLAFESAIAVRRSAESGKAAPEQVEIARVELHVVSEDSVRVNRRPVARADMALVLRPLLEATALPRVVVDCESGVSHGAVVNVLDQAKLCGATEIAVMGK